MYRLLKDNERIESCDQFFSDGKWKPAGDSAGQIFDESTHVPFRRLVSVRSGKSLEELEESLARCAMENVRLQVRVRELEIFIDDRA